MSRISVRTGFLVTIGAAALTVAFSLAHEVRAQAKEPSRAEKLIQYRQAIYKVMSGNFGPVAAMATGKAPFDAKDLATRAERVAYLAQMLDEAYPDDSQRGAPTRAKAQIWENRAEFDKLLDDMQMKTSELAKVARTGDEARIRTAVGEAGRSCKACHDEYRAEE
jgi:cytochrome c556